MLTDARKRKMEELRARILRVTRMRDELAPVGVAAVVGCSHVTVRKVQREAGMYVRRGPGGKRREP